METAALLKVDRRSDLGKGYARRLRVAGRIPGVCYGHNRESIHVSVEPVELVERLRGTHGLNAVFTLDIEGETQVVRVAGFQKDPVKRKLIHVDFAVVDPKKLLRLEVPLVLTGTSQAIKEGGLLRQMRRTVPVKVLPSAIPPCLELDITDLHVGQISKVSVLKTPEGVALDSKEDFGIVQIYIKRGEEEEEELGEEGEEAPAEAEE